jgi:hypothetical protein
MLDAWIALLGVALIVWIASTTRLGKRLRARLGIPARSGRAPRKDRDYLLRVCGGDPARVARLLAAARRGEMTEAELYRRAIRLHLRDRS